MRECTAILYTLTGYEFLVLGSKHPTILFTGHKSIIFSLHRILISTIEYKYLKFLKYCNLHLLSAAGKKIALPDTSTRNIPQERITRNTTVIIQLDKKKQRNDTQIEKNSVIPRLNKPNQILLIIKLKPGHNQDDKPNLCIAN